MKIFSKLLDEETQYVTSLDSLHNLPFGCFLEAERREEVAMATWQPSISYPQQPPSITTKTTQIIPINAQVKSRPALRPDLC